MKVRCQHCNKEFEIAKWQIVANRGKYCSRTCFDIAKRKKTGVEVDGKWFTIYKGKYYEHHSKEGVLYLHRYIWEKHNGRIPENMCVHHKDCDRLNNSLDNLELKSKVEHTTMHAHKSLKDNYLKTINNLKKASDAAKAWHSSKEGRKWHSIRAKKYWEAKKIEQHRRQADSITRY